MDSEGIELKLYLDDIKIPLDVNTFEGRLKIQKAVYIGKIAGVDLGYNFTHYKRGPYSKELADKYFRTYESINKGNEDFSNYKFIWEIEDKITSFKDIFSEYKNYKGFTQEYWLESIASLIYWIKRGYNWNESKDKVLSMKNYLSKYLDNAEVAIKKYDIC